MKIEQKLWKPGNGWTVLVPQKFDHAPELVLVFGDKVLLKDRAQYDEIKKLYPESHILTCSASGEIFDTQVNDDTLSLIAMQFNSTKVKFSVADIKNIEESEEIGIRLGMDLPHDGLVHVMVFSEGVHINATGLVRGLTQALPKNVAVTGGLAGDVSTIDSTKFEETVVGLDEPPQSGKIVVVGFYGDKLRVGYGSLGGWDTFGPERLITKAKGNTLFELDGKPALQLYKEYLGEKAKDLPSAGLLFPISVRFMSGGKEVELVRTFFSINEAEQSLTFVGEIPEGAYAKLMRANYEHIIDGATDAANMTIESLRSGNAELAILVSCIGRKLVLKERTEEEIEEVKNVLGKQTAVVGFYSYGEICPTAPTEKQCQFHNQTMTITTFREE